MIIVRVGIYCRLSDEDRDKINKNDDSDSIINQRSMCLKYANQNGWNVIDIYSDDDFSGVGVDRPDFNRLINDCKDGKINLVLCKSQSRFSRDMEIIEKYLHKKFVEWGVRFVSIVDNADTSIDSNKKSRQINSLINEWYLDDLSTNIKSSLKNKREDGLFIGSFAPYGYERSEDKHKLIIDHVAAEIVRKIFELYVNGYGYHKICEYLNNNKIPTRSVYKKQKGSKYYCPSCNLNTVRWSPDTIAQILKNEVYIGNLVQGKKTSLGYKIHKFKKVSKKDWCRVENTHEAIIDIETWNKVQKILSTHSSPINNGEIHYFSNKIYCNLCDKSFMRNVYNVKKANLSKRAYMQCKGNKKYHICENNKAIKMEVLEEIILNALNDFFNNYYDEYYFKKLYEIKNRHNVDDNKIIVLEKEKMKNQKVIEENKKYYRNLYEDKVKGIISENIFKSMSSLYLKENEIMNMRIECIDKEIDNIKLNIEKCVQVDEILKKYKPIRKLNKIIMDEFIHKIYIGAYDNENKRRNIIIEWNF